jgi:hypothetical protein
LFLYRKILSLLAELDELRNAPPGTSAGYSDLKEQLAMALQNIQLLKAERDHLKQKVCFCLFEFSFLTIYLSVERFSC